MNFTFKPLTTAGAFVFALTISFDLMAWGSFSEENGFIGQYDGGSNSSSPASFTDDVCGGDTYSSFNVREIESKLFSDKDIVSKVNIAFLQNALMTRNVDAIASFAWNLKGVERMLGKKDRKTTSRMLFDSAAQLAIEQGNSKALNQIIALAPECKIFKEQLVFNAKTHRINKSVTAFPQLILFSQKDGAKTLEGLQSWEQPLLGSYIRASFRGMTQISSDTASMLVNEGRISMNPQMIAMGAMELSKYPYDSKLGIKFEPAQIFAEAAELAIANQDRVALQQIVALYETANFKIPDYAQYLQGEVAMLVEDRGLKSDGVYRPGGSPSMNFKKLIRTVYYEETKIPVK